MKFKAKPKYATLVQAEEDEFGEFDWLKESLDEEGYIHGYYVDGYILGGIEEVTDEYFAPSSWCPIDKSTLAAIGGDDE